LDPGASSPTLLVYRVPTVFPLPEGWYDPMLKVDPEILKSLANSKPGQPDEWDDLNFTFSVGSNRRNVQLITGLVQDPNSRTRGTLNRADGYATIQVQVSAGSSVLGARVRGFYQMIVRGSEPVVMKFVEFADGGLDGDVKADDGIYTARIDIHEVEKDTEFRVFVLADTTNGQAHYIPLDDPNRGDRNADPVDVAAIPAGNRPRDREAAAREAFDARKLKAEQDTKAAEGTAIRFQRGTTIHFWVKP
jgi:hypothetical protein